MLAGLFDRHRVGDRVARVGHRPIGLFGDREAQGDLGFGGAGARLASALVTGDHGIGNLARDRDVRLDLHLIAHRGGLPGLQRAAPLQGGAAADAAQIRGCGTRYVLGTGDRGQVIAEGGVHRGTAGLLHGDRIGQHVAGIRGRLVHALGHREAARNRPRHLDSRAAAVAEREVRFDPGQGESRLIADRLAGLVGIDLDPEFQGLRTVRVALVERVIGSPVGLLDPFLRAGVVRIGVDVVRVAGPPEHGAADEACRVGIRIIGFGALVEPLGDPHRVRHIAHPGRERIGQEPGDADVLAFVLRGNRVFELVTGQDRPGSIDLLDRFGHRGVHRRQVDRDARHAEVQPLAIALHAELGLRGARRNRGVRDPDDVGVVADAVGRLAGRLAGAVERGVRGEVAHSGPLLVAAAGDRLIGDVVAQITDRLVLHVGRRIALGLIAQTHAGRRGGIARRIVVAQRHSVERCAIGPIHIRVRRLVEGLAEPGLAGVGHHDVVRGGFQHPGRAVEISVGPGNRPWDEAVLLLRSQGFEIRAGVRVPLVDRGDRPGRPGRPGGERLRRDVRNFVFAATELVDQIGHVPDGLAHDRLGVVAAVVPDFAGAGFGQLRRGGRVFAHDPVIEPLAGPGQADFGRGTFFLQRVHHIEPGGDHLGIRRNVQHRGAGVVTCGFHVLPGGRVVHVSP